MAPQQSDLQEVSITPPHQPEVIFILNASWLEVLFHTSGGIFGAHEVKR
jgi:hypothetical protein